MDRETRNRIQRATQDARALLEQDYAEQLGGTFDIRLDGTIADEPGDHLDAQQRLVRSKLVAAVEHLRAGGRSNDDAVAAYLREAAFTTLNRFVALKMLEARGLVQECLSRGEESSGFKEFTGLAPGLVQLSDHGYRLYIESLFDEIGREVRVLFDRRDPASLLWPERKKLLELLTILNVPELSSVWGEDETIGWVYQYFNSDDDRHNARYDEKGKPKAPSNSRELAVRNQFFTPRYVVQFLTDNTLGRIWYEMRQGDTRLRDLDYLVRRPKEVFLAEGENPPTEAVAEDEDLTQEELLQRPVHVPFRAKKDPRDIRVLDPACGSGHFLLYAFDLVLAIYEEAWADEASPASDATGRALRDDYPKLKELRAAVPGLVLRYNLHGIDIDARCAQIAALALWMRAQRAYKDLGIPRDARPPIQKTNIVVAEPMPGDPELRREFIATLEPKLGKLVERVFDRMELAGEAGSLLRIEKDLRDTIQDILGEHGELFRKPDEERWRLAEEDVVLALRAYAERATNGRAYQRRLFAEDAARGLGLVDLCGRRYDVVLMNPPFGQVPAAVYPYLTEHFSGAHNDVFASFVARGCELAGSSGLLGSITSRGFLVAPRMEEFRIATVVPRAVVLADLGDGVMDDAFVESCAYVLETRQHDDAPSPSSFIAFDLRNSSDIAQRPVRSWPTACSVTRAAVSALPNSRLLYSLPPRIQRLLKEAPTFEPKVGTAREGMKTFDNTRFLRLRWEVSPSSVGADRHWSFLAKGGTFAFYLGNYNVLVNWSDDGRELQEINLQKNGSTAQVRQASTYWRRSGVTYSGRSQKGFSARALPEGLIISGRGPAILETSRVGSEYILGWVNSRLIRALIHLQASDAYFATGIIKRLPWLPLDEEDSTTLVAETRRALRMLVQAASCRERSTFYLGPFVGATIREGILQTGEALLAAECARNYSMTSWDVAVDEAYGVESASWAGDLGVDGDASGGSEDDEGDESGGSVEISPRDYATQVVSFAVGVAFGRWKPALLWQRDDVLREISPFGPLSPEGCGGSAHPVKGSRPVLVDDPGAREDVSQHIADVVAELFPGENEAPRALAATIGVSSLRRYLQGTEPNAFFTDHLSTYSVSRRKAPIYWQLATPSASYSVWLFYHRFTRDTLYRVLNDYVSPKLKHEERKLTSLMQDAGPNPSAGQRKEIDAQEAFVAELRAFRDEVARVAPLWNPDLNDGVIINFAPLWRLVPQNRSWQKECKKVWDKLCAGDYDWAHLAMHLWPERVVPKCAKDRSLAIAHGLEDAFWEEDEDGKWRARDQGSGIRVQGSGFGEQVDRLVAERTSTAVKSALDELLRAPAPAKPTRGRRGGGRRRATKSRSTTSASSRSNPSIGSSSVDDGTLEAVKQAIGAAGEGASKSDVVEATGISNNEWNVAIKTLLDRGDVVKTGVARGTRYHFSKKGSSA